MNDKLKTLIRNLGGKFRKPQSVASFVSGAHFYSSQGRGPWDGHEDPLGQLENVSATIRSFTAVTWSAQPFFRDDPDYDELIDVELCGASENNDAGDKDGRRLLYHVGWEPENQRMFAVNLLDRSDDPAVYSFDHDDPEENYPKFRKLSLFLGSLKTKKMLSKTKRAADWIAQIEEASDEDEDYEKAIALSKKALKQHPAEASFALNLGIFYFQVGDQRKEEAAYRHALEIEPDYNDALSLLGNVHARRREMDKALELINRAIANDGDDAEAHYQLACAYGLAKRKAEMLEALERAVGLDAGLRDRAAGEVDFAAFRKDPDLAALVKAKKTPRGRKTAP
ncbi:MAG TPA: tetratricopeptide repeat protein [Polyangia bacterium]|jgi:tetratricopeptide (TPR) repeat protein|nr:tetratricopeptide repeat protein [Polyangia bacterium]